MNISVFIIIITVFLMINSYNDGKYVKLLKSWKKYYQIAGIGFMGLSTYLFLNKNPGQVGSFINNANGLMKYMPIDNDGRDLLSPILKFSKNAVFGENTNKPINAIPNNLFKNISSSQPIISSQQNTKRAVSETKKKYVAAQQGWTCGDCTRQLPAWFEVDHRIRLDRGGTNDVNNLVAMCRDCHGKKTSFENL